MTQLSVGQLSTGSQRNFLGFHLRGRLAGSNKSCKVATLAMPSTQNSKTMKGLRIFVLSCTLLLANGLQVPLPSRRKINGETEVKFAGCATS
jgi:hypothetical protein